MGEFLDLTIRIITLDLFIGYGLFTFIWLVTSKVRKLSGTIEALDIKASRFIQFVGVAYFVCVVVMLTTSVILVDGYQIRWYPLFQVLVWTIMTQLLSIKKIRENKVVRFVFALLFIISFEIFVIIVTSFHREYSNGGLLKHVSIINMVVGLASKTAIFCILAMIYSLLRGVLPRTP